MLTAIAVLIAAIVGVVIVLLALASRRPDTFSVRRSATIAAPPEVIYPLIASLRRMNEWNPFVKPDPAIVLDYSGPDSGKGAAHTWRGNRHVGEGRIEITEASPPSRVVLQLDMSKPMTAHNRVEFTLEPAGAETTVTWAMSGRQPLMAKVMSLLIDCDRMVGGQFEKGLAGLKGIAEQR